MPDVVHVVGSAERVLTGRGVSLRHFRVGFRDREPVLNARFEISGRPLHEREGARLVIRFAVAAGDRGHVQSGKIVPVLGRSWPIEARRHQLPLHDVFNSHRLVQILLVLVVVDVFVRANRGVIQARGHDDIRDTLARDVETRRRGCATRIRDGASRMFPDVRVPSLQNQVELLPRPALVRADGRGSVRGGAQVIVRVAHAIGRQRVGVDVRVRAHRADARRTANRILLIVPSLVVVEQLGHVVLVDVRRVAHPVPVVPVGPPPRVVRLAQRVRHEDVLAQVRVRRVRKRRRHRKGRVAGIPRRSEVGVPRVRREREPLVGQRLDGERHEPGIRPVRQHERDVRRVRRPLLERHVRRQRRARERLGDERRRKRRRRDVRHESGVRTARQRERSVGGIRLRRGERRVGPERRAAGRREDGDVGRLRRRWRVRVVLKRFRDGERLEVVHRGGRLERFVRHERRIDLARDRLDGIVEHADILVEVAHFERGEPRGVAAVRRDQPALEIVVRRLRPFVSQLAEHRGVYARDVVVEVRHVRPDDVPRRVVVVVVLVILDPRVNFRVHGVHVIRRRGGFESGVDRVEVGTDVDDARRRHRAVPLGDDPLLQRGVRVRDPLRVHLRGDVGVDRVEVGGISVDQRGDDVLVSVRYEERGELVARVVDPVGARLGLDVCVERREILIRGVHGGGDVAVPAVAEPPLQLHVRSGDPILLDKALDRRVKLGNVRGRRGDGRVRSGDEVVVRFRRQPGAKRALRGGDPLRLERRARRRVH